MNSKYKELVSILMDEWFKSKFKKVEGCRVVDLVEDWIEEYKSQWPLIATEDYAMVKDGLMFKYAHERKNYLAAVNHFEQVS